MNKQEPLALLTELSVLELNTLNTGRCRLKLNYQDKKVPQLMLFRNRGVRV